VPIELVHGDLFGLITLVTRSESRYFILLVDDYSRYMWLRTLRSKDQVASTIKMYQQVTEAEMGRKLGVFWTDRGGKCH
jgi:hypothetical protein